MTKSESQNPGFSENPGFWFSSFVILGVASWLIYAAFSWLSRDFGYETPGPQRPILVVLALLAVAFLLHLPAIYAAIRADGHRDLVPAIWVFAIAFRATLLFTEPFQEVDIYRYVWDGQVAAAGVSPYRYSPAQLRAADARDPLPDDLRRLVALRDSDPTIATVLARIHHGDLTTVYPPVSQAVFVAAAATTPSGANLRTQLAVMKTWITAFDLLTLFLLIRILRHVGKPVGWSVAYGWCPLVVKEFANTGHLDSIAVCLTTAAVYFALKAFFPIEAAAAGSGDDGRRSRIRKNSGDSKLFLQNSHEFCYHATAAGVLLGLAIGAKLYPVVLAPLLFVTAWRRSHWRTAVAAGLTAGLVSAGALAPMFMNRSVDRSTADSAPPLPGAPSATPSETALSRNERRRSNDGLSAFLSRWKMNDFLFQLVEANVSPRTGNGREPEPWFAVTPVAWRESAIRTTRAFWKSRVGSEISDDDASFLLARFLTGSIFLILALWLAWKTPRENHPQRFLEWAFLTLAWFWLLQPTQNPWYWIWALPFAPFARGRAWLAMSGLVLCYYARFWFVHHCSNVELLHTPYRGADFYDNVVVWLEFAPWFVWLATAYFLRSRRRGPSIPTSSKRRSGFPA